jgi:hypothetical protein
MMEIYFVFSPNQFSHPPDGESFHSPSKHFSTSYEIDPDHSARIKLHLFTAILNYHSGVVLNGGRIRPGREFTLNFNFPRVYCLCEGPGQNISLIRFRLDENMEYENQIYHKIFS